MTPPVFSHGSLRLYLLMLLDEQPRHGCELIQALSDRFGGTYVPSAGTIYPRLAKLEEEGLVTKETDGRKTVYAITDAGRAELAARQGDLHSIENEVSDSVRRLADEVRAGVNQAMKSLRADLASAAREARRDTATFVAGTGADTASDSTARAGGSENWSAGPRTNGATPSDGAASEGSAPANDSHGGDSGNGGAPTAGAAAGVESRLALHDADLALTRFRQELRTELRKRATRGAVSRSAVELLERRLAEVRTEVLAALEASS